MERMTGAAAVDGRVSKTEALGLGLEKIADQAYLDYLERTNPEAAANFRRMEAIQTAEREAGIARFLADRREYIAQVTQSTISGSHEI